MAKRNVLIAEGIGKSWADSMFKDFIEHPEYKGTNFTWENFPDLAASLARVSLFMSYKNRPKNLEELKKICYDVCYKHSQELVRKNNLI